MKMPLLSLEIRLEVDVVLARQRARQIGALLGFSQLDQTKIATATSEIARNTVQYAGGGRVEFAVENGTAPAMVIRFRERGPGIKDLQAILDGRYESPTGLGLGIIGARRLMDRFAIESTPGSGAVVVMIKTLPPRSEGISPEEFGRISAELARNAPRGLLDELQQQNQELLIALQELRNTQSEIAQMHTRELEETNRGVVALYAELDEGTKALKRLSELKSRFLSEMSHEFRSPLNSIKGLAGLLMARSDGELTAEQEKQIRFIRQSADGLSTLVDDLLDLARVEAGKAAIRVRAFSVDELFESLEGTIRPTVDRTVVSLGFDNPDAIGELRTDEGKVSQILRNFLSNAVKFTERGEIRVSALPGPRDCVIFSVRDSGIGIAAENLNRIFDEYGQIDSPLQGRAKGVGLGLPLTRKLAQLLGGEVSVRSEIGAGSEFLAEIPRYFGGVAQDQLGGETAREIEGSRGVVVMLDNEPALRFDPGHDRVSLERALIVDDMIGDRYLIKGTLAAIGQFDIIEADHGEAALGLARTQQPDVIFLDLSLPDMSGFDVLARLKSDALTQKIPVIIHTSKTLNEEERGRLVKEGVAVLAKGNRSREAAIAQVRDSLLKAGLRPQVRQTGAQS